MASVLLLVLFAILKLDFNGAAPRYSATLSRTVTEDGNEERVDYLDENGRPAFAEDRHYASVVRTRDDCGRVISEVYLDEDGRPAAQPEGHCGLKKAYDALGRNDRIVYTDGKGRPMKTDMGYAMLEYVLDEAGRVIEQWYFDADGRSVADRYEAFGMVHAYDELGRRAASTHVDSQGRPYRITLGFATIRREFYGNGLMRRALFLDEAGNPAQSKYGHCGYEYEYDAQGREAVTTFIDSLGRPMVAGTGYATVRRTYDDAGGAVEREMYFDGEGNPIRLSKGQYGVRFEGYNQVYLDANGRDIFSPYTLLYNNPMSVVFLALAVCAASLALNHRGNAVLLIAYLSFILYMTLMNRSANEASGGAAFLWSYRRFFSDMRLRQEILNNIWLFIPLGTVLYRLMGWTGLLAAFGLSAAIEAAQYLTGFGLAEFDDLLSNGLGGFTGCGIADLMRPREYHCDKRERIAT